MARTIRVDDEVYGWLQARAKPFEDSPNSVLRRVLGLETKEKPGPEAEKKPGPEAGEEPAAEAGGPQNIETPAADRFRKSDRKRAKAAAEAALGFKLKRTGDDPRIFTDPDGHLYGLAGGQERIALPAEIMARADATAPEARLLIALSSDKALRIFTVPLAALARDSGRLPPGGDGELLIRISGSDTEAPAIAEQPELLLAFLVEA